MTEEKHAEEESLKQAIQNLSNKRHVISKEALDAKKRADDHARALGREAASDSKTQNLLLQEFNQSIRLLMSVFKESNFDDMALVVTNPWRIFTLNFCIGVLRGLGFCLGVILVLLFFAFKTNALEMVLQVFERAQ